MCKSSAFTQTHTSIKYLIESEYFQKSRRTCMESTPRWPTTGTGLTTQSNRTEEENFVTRGNFAAFKKNTIGDGGSTAL